MGRESPKVDLTPRIALAAGKTSRPAGGAILHPTDYSVSSRHALELACRIARDRRSQLVVMHVAEPVRSSSFGMAQMPPLPNGYRGAGESRLRLHLPADPNVQVEHRLEEGEVAPAILRVADEINCDLIVMAGRKRTWLGRLLFGSVTAQIERNASCPVLKVDTHQLEVATESRRLGAGLPAVEDVGSAKRLNACGYVIDQGGF